MRLFLACVLSLAMASSPLAAEKETVKTPDSLQAAFDETIAAARRAIDKYGVTDSAMLEIQAALAKLASNHP